MTTPAEERQALQAAATKRIQETPALWPWEDVILAVWDDTADHWRWLLDAPTDELIAWAEKLGGPPTD